MVRAGRYSGDLRTVFSRPRSAASARANDDARGRRWNQGMVYETDPARGGACLQLRLSPSAQQKVGADFWANFRRRNAGFLSAAPIQPQLRGESRRLVCTESSDEDFAETFAVWL